MTSPAVQAFVAGARPHLTQPEAEGPAEGVAADGRPADAGSSPRAASAPRSRTS